MLAAMLGIPATGVYSKATEGDIGEPRSSYMLGSAKKCEGKLLIVNFFVDTPKSKWNIQSIKKMKKPLKTATDYIKKQAAVYDVSVEFVFDWEQNSALYHRTATNCEPGEDETFENYLDGKIVQWLEYNPTYDELLEKYDADGVFAIIWFNTQGRAYAICYDGIDNPDETLVAFSQDSPCVLTHEILHLFGAHDYYEGAEYSTQTVEFLKREYPNEIMLSVNDGANVKRDVSPLTAYHLGWVESAAETESFSELIR